ncbi:hypothetical protein ES703_91913 [subsurface metagenome]
MPRFFILTLKVTVSPFDGFAGDQVIDSMKRSEARVSKVYVFTLLVSLLSVTSLS